MTAQFMARKARDSVFLQKQIAHSFNNCTRISTLRTSSKKAKKRPCSNRTTTDFPKICARLASWPRRWNYDRKMFYKLPKGKLREATCSKQARVAFVDVMQGLHFEMQRVYDGNIFGYRTSVWCDGAPWPFYELSNILVQYDQIS